MGPDGEHLSMPAARRQRETLGAATCGSTHPVMATLRRVTLLTTVTDGNS
jgi:hypothetical protein